MTSTANGNLRVIGDNSASGGRYNSAKLVGDAVINGDLDCAEFKSVGKARIDGSVKTKNAKIVGSLSVKGSFESEEATITGNLETSGDIKSRSLVSRGGIETKGKIAAEEIRFVGYCTIRKSCEAETFRSEGPLNIAGMLNADEINIGIHSRCRIGEIGGGKIHIRRGRYSKIGDLIKSLFTPNDFFMGKLVTESIEGDEIRIENTKSKIVRGKNVVLGDGCEIDLLEYTEECRVSSKSVVKEKKKISG